MKPSKAEIAYPLIFVLISALYFREGIMDGALLTASGDAIQYFYPTYEAAWRMLHSGELPLWNPYIFSGMPLIGAHQHALLYPPTLIIMSLFDPRTGFNLDFALHYAAAGYFAFLYLRRVSGSWAVALPLAVSAELMGLLHLNPDHLSILRTALWLPASLWLMGRLFERPSLTRSLHLGLALAMIALAGHAQIALYSALALIAHFMFMIIEAEPASRLRSLAWASLSAVSSLIIASPQLIATAELASLSARTALSFEEFTSGSINPAMLGGLFYPGLYANPYRFALGGFVTIIAAGTAIRLVIHRDRPAIFWAAVALGAAALSMGEHLPGYALMSRVPGYNLFRCPERLWYIVQIAALTLAAMGMRDIVREPLAKGAWYLRWAAGSLLFIGLLPLFGGALFRQEHGALSVSYASAAVIAPLAIAALCVAALYIVRGSDGRYAKAALVAIAALIAMEGFLIRPEIKGWDEYARGVALERPAGYLRELRALVGTGRVGFYTTSYEEMGVSISAPLLNQTRMMGGYDPLAPKAYLDALGFESIGRAGPERIVSLLMDGAALRAHSVRALAICKLDAEQIRSAHGYQYETYMRTHGGKCALYRNNAALPRAYIVSSANAEISGGDMAFDPWAAVSEGARIETESASRVTVKAAAPEDGAYLVLADQFYPGWRATMDGRSAPIARANAILRAVRMERGEHEIVFEYRPSMIYAALYAMLAAYAAIAALLIFVSMRGRGAGSQAAPDSIAPTV